MCVSAWTALTANSCTCSWACSPAATCTDENQDDAEQVITSLRQRLAANLLALVCRRPGGLRQEAAASRGTLKQAANGRSSAFSLDAKGNHSGCTSVRFLPAGVHAHILHPHRDDRGGALPHGAKVHTGGDQLEAPRCHIRVGQRSGSALPPDGLFHRQELEQGAQTGLRPLRDTSGAPRVVGYLLVRDTAGFRAQDGGWQSDFGPPGLPSHIHLDGRTPPRRGPGSAVIWHQHTQTLSSARLPQHTAFQCSETNLQSAVWGWRVFAPASCRARTVLGLKVAEDLQRTNVYVVHRAVPNRTKAKNRDIIGTHRSAEERPSGSPQHHRTQGSEGDPVRGSWCVVSAESSGQQAAACHMTVRRGPNRSDRTHLVERDVF